MKIRYIQSLIICLFVVLSVFNVYSQESNILYFLKGVPQSSLQNPALHNDSSQIIIGVPGLSGVYFDLNSNFATGDFMHKGTGSLADSLVLDLDNFYESLDETNTLQQTFSAPIIYLGVRIKNSMFSFNVNERLMARFTFDKDFIGLLKDGNSKYLGETYDLGYLDLDALYYHEFALGYSNEIIKKKLTIGVKAKILSGQFGIQTENMNLQLESAADASYLNLNSKMKINTSMPMQIEYDENNHLKGISNENLKISDYITQQGNMGFAFDFGVVVQPIDKLILSASILDVGNIKFTKNVNNLNHEFSYKWEGIDFSNSLDESQANYVDPSDLLDDEFEKIKDGFRPRKDEITSESFKMKLPTSMFFGASYDLLENLNFGFVDRMYKNEESTKNLATISANAIFWNFLSLSGTYSMGSGSYQSIGLGTAIRFKPVQIYVASDNLFALTDISKVDSFSVRFGLNLLIGVKK